MSSTDEPTPSPAELPSSLGYRLPAEWEPHEATWIAWPRNKEDWPGKFGPIRWVYAEIVRYLSRSERVRILVGSGKAERRAADALEKSGVDPDRVEFVRHRTDRGWLRDSGPMFVVRDRSHGAEGEPPPVALVDWKFNAWAKYDNWTRDNRLPRFVADRLGMTRWAPRTTIEQESRRVVLEGGAVDVNGLGTLITTEECLLSHEQERNPGLDRAGYEQLLRDYLGASKVIWLGRGIVGDDTHGHVDDIARFVDETTVVACVEENEGDPNHGPLRENLERLREATDQDHRPLRVVELPMPAPVVFDGQRIPASYANFYVANSVVLVPTFNDPKDRVALGILADLFPGRVVVGIHAVELVWGLGTLHCLTRDQPKGPEPSAG
ncbi:agmatine deiminase family protein [Tautonia plasticadhaerens]|uniref:Agmatine deiminase n=1 Tax=Tautonia plasticadhaerens TaxID=2527974 RepID=A0A518HBH7_9BACT|nr:agmatine deiminase family protein [Tautonia plasticadhaerens]QDV38187.1 Agmatine deiminase [Tautonia plasticadhaerens]